MKQTANLLGVGIFILTTTVPVLVAASSDVDNICAEKYPGFAGFITEADSGRTFRNVDTGRFGFCLNEAKYPLKDLDTSDCDTIIGGPISNWSLRGPGNYPIGFEIIGIGSCVVRNGLFHVRIVGTELKK